MVLDKIEETGAYPMATELVEHAMEPLVIIVPIVFIILAFTFLYMIFVSHRTAGPLYHLCRAMEKVGKGDLSVKIKFRRNDEIQEVAEVFNDMVAALRKRFVNQKRHKKK